MATGIRARQKLGKFRIEKRLGDGGFATVYSAMDTIQGIRVALKIPHEPYVTDEVLREFRREVRTTCRLDHPNILSIKDASIIDGRFVIVFPLGEKTLHDRMRSRMSFELVLELCEQVIAAAAHAHRRRIIHCDIKPENVILFDKRSARLTDFGIAKVAQRTIRGSGTGTVGYMAPEQAMGKPSFKSDVFSLGLMMYRMLSGHWPEWPFEWPPQGYQRLRQKAHPELIAFLKKAIDPNPRRRYRDADQMLNVFRRLRARTLRHAQVRPAPVRRAA